MYCWCIQKRSKKSLFHQSELLLASKHKTKIHWHNNMALYCCCSIVFTLNREIHLDTWAVSNNLVNQKSPKLTPLSCITWHYLRAINYHRIKKVSRVHILWIIWSMKLSVGIMAIEQRIRIGGMPTSSASTLCWGLQKLYEVLGFWSSATLL